MSKKVYLSPSDQTKNAYAYGGTTEAIQCGKIAAACKTALERCGIRVKVGQYDTMANRCAASDAFGADLHVPIHTNACNGKVSGTRMFCYNATGKGMQACKAIYSVLAPLTPGTSENISVNAELYEVARPAAPTAYIEVDFHDVPAVAKWIIEHTTEIGEAIAKGICGYFGVPYQAAGSTAKPAAATTSAAKTTAAAKTTTAKTTNTEVCEVTLPKLSKGANSGYVKTAQILLNKYNSAGLAEDGGFGEKTYAAVVAYQKSRKLDVDGVIGAQTWGQLLK